MPNYTAIFKKACAMARRVLFPNDNTLVIEGLKNDDTAAYGRTITIKDYWYGKRARAIDKSNDDRVYTDVIDFYVADGVGLDDTNFQSNERLTTQGRRYSIMDIKPPLSEPRFWRVRCNPTGEPV